MNPLVTGPLFFFTFLTVGFFVIVAVNTKQAETRKVLRPLQTAETCCKCDKSLNTSDLVAYCTACSIDRTMLISSLQRENRMLKDRIAAGTRYTKEEILTRSERLLGNLKQMDDE